MFKFASIAHGPRLFRFTEWASFSLNSSASIIASEKKLYFLSLCSIFRLHCRQIDSILKILHYQYMSGSMPPHGGLVWLRHSLGCALWSVYRRNFFWQIKQRGLFIIRGSRRLNTLVLTGPFKKQFQASTQFPFLSSKCLLAERSWSTLMSVRCALWSACRRFRDLYFIMGFPWETETSMLDCKCRDLRRIWIDR